jgi:YD repeat-containing protein
MVRIYPHRIRGLFVSALVVATVTLAASGPSADAADTATPDGQDAAPVRGAIHGYVFDGERYRTIDVPGATRTEAWDITNRGDVIGYYSNADGRLHGFRLDKSGKYTKFDDPAGDLEDDLTGGNDHGVTVGSLIRYDAAMGEAHGYLRDARGRLTTIDVPGALTTLGWRINNRGQVVGIYSDVDRQVPLRFLRGYIYENGRFTRVDAPGVSNTSLNDINDRGQSVGQAFDAADPRNTHYTFLRDGDGTFAKLPDVPGAAQTIHIGLNNRGQTAATAAFLSADGTFVTLRAFRYDDGEPTRIAVPGSVSTFATAINDSGHIVGYYTDPAPGTTTPLAAAADGAAGMPMGLEAVGMMDRMLP